MTMTPNELVRWRERMELTAAEAARALGVSRRNYLYMEACRTSRGRLLEAIPRPIELACAELERRRAEGTK